MSKIVESNKVCVSNFTKVNHVENKDEQAKETVSQFFFLWDLLDFDWSVDIIILVLLRVL